MTRKGINRSFIGKLAGDSEIMCESRLQPRVELNGNIEAVVDGYKGIIQYDCGVVRLDCGKFCVRFCGDCLKIKNLAFERLVVSGCIASVDFTC